MANILVFGDSIAFGCYDNNGGWVDRLKKDLLANSVDHTDDNYVYDLAIDSDTSEDILSHFESDLRPRIWEGKETVFIFAFGINDSILFRKDGKNKIPMDKFKINLKEISKIAQKYSQKIIFIGPTPGDESKVDPMPWSPTESFVNSEVEKYNKELERFCKSNDYLFLDLYNIFLNSDYMNQLEDGAHPNSKGHEMIYKSVKKFLKKKIHLNT